jgi:hypothetical protein
MAFRFIRMSYEEECAVLTNADVEAVANILPNADAPLQPTQAMLESANRLFRIPVFLSHPSRLNSVQQEFVDAMIFEIRRALLFPRTLPDSEQYPETPLTNIRRMMLSSFGLVALNLRQREVSVLRNNLGQPQQLVTWEGSPFSQIEPGMAYQYGLPILLVRESGVEQNGVWSFGVGPFLILEWDSSLPVMSFFKRIDWREIFQNWTAQVRNGFYLQTEPPFRYECQG